MKKLILIPCIFLLFLSVVNAQVGCKIGNYILTTPNGSFYMNGSDRLPVYTYNPGNSNTIAKRNGPTDTQCGILRSVADAYPKASGSPSNPSASCSPSNNLGDIGTLVTYRTSDNNCITNVPLDDYVWLIAACIIALSIYNIRYELV